MNLITVSGVKGFVDENGTAWLNLMEVSKGLGFVETKPSGVEYVRWSRVFSYLDEFGFSTSGEDGFIPENIFYLLAMKASNQTAVAFQMKVANEILPSIRKTGSYSVTPKQLPSSESQRIRAEAMHLNAKTRQAKMLKDVAVEFKSNLSSESIQSLISGMTELLTGQRLLPMPTIGKTFSATEIGMELGVSSVKIGKLANANYLKTDEFGITVLDKSRHSTKQIPSFRYNELGREKLRELVNR